MKTFHIKYFLMGLIKSFEVTAHSCVEAEKEFERLKGDYPIYKTLLYAKPANTSLRT